MRLRFLFFVSLLICALAISACGESTAPERLSVRLYNQADLGLPNAASTDTLRLSVLDRRSGKVIQRDTIAVNSAHDLGTFDAIPYGQDLQLFVEALNSSGSTIASGGSSHFNVLEDAANSESFFIFLVNTNEFSPASGIFVGPPGGPALQVNPSPFEGEQPRAGHRAVNLSDGRALIIGGASLTAHGSGVGQSNIAATHASIVVYDPRNGYFDLLRDNSGSAVSLKTSRAYHTVTDLGDDRFLVTGGVHTPLSNNLEVLSSVELISRANNGNFVVTQLNPMNSARMRHTASLRSDGSVLVVGGATLSGTEATAIKSAELFRDGGFVSAGEMADARYNHTATPLADPDKIALCGGIRIPGEVLSTCELFSKGDNGQTFFIPIPAMSTARHSHAATLLNPKSQRFILLAGGFTTDNTSTPTASYEILDTVEGRFRPDLVTDTLKKARGAFDIVNLSRNDDVMLIGGIGIAPTGSGTASIPDVEVLSAITPGEIDYVPQLLGSTMSNGRFDHDSILLSNGMVLVTGGGQLQNGVTTSLLFSDIFNPGPPDIVTRQ